MRIVEEESFLLVEAVEIMELLGCPPCVFLLEGIPRLFAAQIMEVSSVFLFCFCAVVL